MRTSVHGECSDEFSNDYYATFLFHVERRLAEKGDNARERALMMMMQGRLEANPEDELKKDLVPPDFIINKPQEEWSEDDQKAAKEFERKKQQLQEDREKYRKSLETELKKLQSGISEATAVFDEKLGQLFQRKVKTEMVIYQVCWQIGGSVGEQADRSFRIPSLILVGHLAGRLLGQSIRRQ